MIKSLGYIGLSAPDLDEWANYATRLLGFQCGERAEGRLGLRMDSFQQRIIIDTTLQRGRHFYGWEACDSSSLDALIVRLESAGVRVREEPVAVAEQRAVGRLISFSDPAENRLEVFVNPFLAHTPFVPSKRISGFRTGELGLGHVVLTVSDPRPMLTFYRDLLGFRLSDYMLRPFEAYFFHVNPRHHSLALIGTGSNGLHHIMIELLGLDDVGQAYDLALTEPGRVGVTLGRHSNDFVTSFYARSPSECMFEYGWGGRLINQENWQPVEFCHGASLWGHERDWLTADQRAEALRLRLQAAADGFTAPVHVVEGHYVANDAI